MNSEVPKKNEQHTTRRSVLAGAGSAVLGSLASISGHTQQHNPDVSGEATWSEGPGGPPNPEGSVLWNAIRSIVAEYNSKKGNDINPMMLDEFKQKMYRASLAAGAQEKRFVAEYGTAGMGTRSTPLIDKFEADVKAVDSASIAATERDAQKRALLDAYIKRAIELKMFEGEFGLVDEDMINALIQGYYCGYMAICPPRA